MYKMLKKDFPNLYIILVTVSIALWFRVVGNFMDMLAPKSGLVYYYIGIATVCLGFLYFNDFSLSELYGTPDAGIAGGVGGGFGAFETMKM